MSESRYGNLLDKYMNGGQKYTNQLLNESQNKHEAEGKTRYGDLLKNAKPNYKLYEDMVKISECNRKIKQQRAEEEHQNNLRRQRRIEQEQIKEQERKDRINAAIDNMLKKKKAEQEVIEEKKKKEQEQAEIYKHIEKLMQTSPKAAEAYAEIYANKLKMI